MALQEGAKVASGTVEALKSQPVALAVIVINVLFLGVAVWLFHEVASSSAADRDHRNKLLDTALTSCGEKIRDDIEAVGKTVQAGVDQLFNELRSQRPKP